MSKPALIVIDMINTYDHKDAELLIPSVEPVVPVITTCCGAHGSRTSR